MRRAELCQASAATIQREINIQRRSCPWAEFILDPGTDSVVHWQRERDVRHSPAQPKRLNAPNGWRTGAFKVTSASSSRRGFVCVPSLREAEGRFEFAYAYDCRRSRSLLSMKSLHSEAAPPSVPARDKHLHLFLSLRSGTRGILLCVTIFGLLMRYLGDLSVATSVSHASCSGVPLAQRRVVPCLFGVSDVCASRFREWFTEPPDLEWLSQHHWQSECKWRPEGHSVRFKGQWRKCSSHRQLGLPATATLLHNDHRAPAP